MSFLDAIVGGRQGMRLFGYQRKLRKLERYAAELAAASDSALSERAADLKKRARAGTSLDALMPEAFALGREASQRVLGMRHYDVQVIGAMALHDELIAEMKTGEGKTLVATLAAFLNALDGNGVHVVTVNDYLAQRDAAWMRPLYEMLGLTVGVITEEMSGASGGVAGEGDDDEDDHDEIARRRAAYAADITYGTNHEIAFDFLRDNLAQRPDEVAHRGFNYAIVDEVDFLLIDEARTPLIISGAARGSSDLYASINPLVERLSEGVHFGISARNRTASFTDEGIGQLEKELAVDSLVDPAHLEMFQAASKLLLAHAIYKRDVDYIVEGDRVMLIDEYTGRVSEDKRFSDGLHQALEAKERVTVRDEDRTLAKITYQTFYGRYNKLSGMTGTAYSEREEFRQTYGRDVQKVPTNRPLRREDFADVIFLKLGDKHDAVAADIAERHERGQPVLVGTTSVRESEQVARRLSELGIEHHVLNAKNHRAEAAIIAQAGRPGAVTISTNMAGRGTDIVLGGNAEALAGFGFGDLDGDGVVDDDELAKLREQCAADEKAVRAAGGLHVIGTARHEAVRIDDQLRGRSGRQGDPGSSQFFVSLDDKVWQRFGQDDIVQLRGELSAARHDPKTPIESSRVERLLRELQKKVELDNFAIRREVLKYDLVVHAQRETIYGWRSTLVSGEGYGAEDLIVDYVDDLLEQHDGPSERAEALAQVFYPHGGETIELPRGRDDEVREAAIEVALEALRAREKQAGNAEAVHELGRLLLLASIDELWTDHLSDLERVEEAIGLRGYAQVDPLVEWRLEAGNMWQGLIAQIRERAVTLWFALDITQVSEVDGDGDDPHTTLNRAEPRRAAKR
ncbi:MAG: preprotein translocase subunit SecA [Myxococcales bacterium]|nr:preprotein translocase subunit SecA [Myxococcales bacterium]